MNEIKILYELGGKSNIPYLLKVYFSKTTGSCCLIMEYCHHIKFRKFAFNLSFDNKKIYMKKLFEALNHLHSKKYIHRDIKSSNVLYNHQTGELRLVDFGLSQTENEMTKLYKTECRKYKMMKKQNQSLPSAERRGTKGIRPIEVLLKSNYQDGKIDVFAAGLLFAGMIAKIEPIFFPNDDQEALLQLMYVYGYHNIQQCADSGHLQRIVELRIKPNYSKLNEFRNNISKIQGFGNMSNYIQTKYPHTKLLTDKLLWDFLDKITALDPNQRFTSKQALMHKFLN